jgi:hypothetical protein
LAKGESLAPQAAPLPDFFSAPYLVGLVPRHILGELAE